MDTLTQLREGMRMWRRARRVQKTGFKRHTGDAQNICRWIIDDCYDAEQGYFRTSTGHFCQFYVRDFAFCCEALLALGQKERITQTLRYVLKRFRAAGRLTSAITPDGRPFDYFLQSGPETPALLLYALTHTRNHSLADEHHAFLQAEVDRFVRLYVDTATGLPRKGIRCSSIRDHAMREGATYDATMIALLARECAALKLAFPFDEKILARRIVDEYWNGSYFFQDRTHQEIVEGDANVFPFWTGIITEKKMRASALATIHATGLDSPFPLRYISPDDKRKEKTTLHLANLFAPDYETDSIWMHLGLAYLHVLAQDDRALAKRHLATYTRLIEEHKTFLEVFDTDGTPFRRRLYVADEGMLWAANYLMLYRRLHASAQTRECQ